MRLWPIWAIEFLRWEYRWTLESIYPCFQDCNMGDSWVIGCLFYHMDCEGGEACLQEYHTRGISRERSRHQVVKEADGIGAHVPILSWCLNLEFSLLFLFTLEASWIDAQYRCALFCLYGDLLGNLTLESHASLRWTWLLVKPPLTIS